MQSFVLQDAIILVPPIEQRGNSRNARLFLCPIGPKLNAEKTQFFDRNSIFCRNWTWNYQETQFFAIFSYTQSQNAQSSIAMCWYVWYGRIKYCGVWHGSIKNISNSENSIISRKLNGILLWNSIFRLKTQFFFRQKLNKKTLKLNFWIHFEQK